MPGSKRDLSTSAALKVYRELFGRTSHGERRRMDFGPLTILNQLAASGDNDIPVGFLPILNMDSRLRL
jgi:hypothetical protein